MYDSKNVGKMKLFEVHLPEAMRAFVGFRQGRLGRRQLSRKYKKLIALGVTFTTQCPIASRSMRIMRVTQAPQIPRLQRPCLSRSPCEPEEPSLMARMLSMGHEC